MPAWRSLLGGGIRTLSVTLLIALLLTLAIEMVARGSAGGAYVLVARPPAAKADNHALRAAFLRLLQRAGALPMPAVAGTMPPASSPSS